MSRLLIPFLCLTLGVIETMRAADETDITLEIVNTCWFYHTENPIFECTVNSVLGNILWKRDAIPIAIGGEIIDDSGMYNLTSYETAENSTLRTERLTLSENLTIAATESDSRFWCENRGYSSQHASLSIPECNQCQSCATTAGLNITFVEVVLPSASAIATIALVAAFILVVVVVVIVAAFYVYGRGRERKESQEQDPETESRPDPGTSRDCSLLDMNASYATDSMLSGFIGGITSHPDKTTSLPLLPYGSNQFLGSAGPSTKSMSKIEYLKPEYQLVRMPSYKSRGGAFLPTRTMRGPAPKAIPEDDDEEDYEQVA